MKPLVTLNRLQHAGLAPPARCGCVRDARAAGAGGRPSGLCARLRRAALRAVAGSLAHAASAGNDAVETPLNSRPASGYLATV